MHTTAYAAFVGLDWADAEHALCLITPDGAVEQSTLTQDAGAIEDWAAALRVRFGGRPVAICLEQSRGAVLYALLKYDHLVLFPLNPKQLASYRDSYTTSGAKNDPTDAELLARLLRERIDRLRAWKPDDELTRALRLLTTDRRDWVDQRTAVGNRLLRHLKEAYPLAVKLLGQNIHGPRFLALLAKFPTQAELQRASPQKLAEFLPKLRTTADGPALEEQHRARVAELRAVPALVRDGAVLQSARLAVVHLVKQLQLCNETIAAYERDIAALMARHPDAPIFTSFPGAGEALAPRLVAAFGADRQKFASAGEVQQLSGIAPITVASGKSKRIAMRRACPKQLRQTFHEFARCSLARCAWAKAYYDLLRAKGHGHHSAVRALAFKWIRILFRCWQTRQTYDDTRYLRQLRAKNAPLLRFLPAPQPQTAA
jgi:transposase